MKESQLIIIYNANSGLMHGVVDLVHKTASPKTYPCKLCAVTFSGAKMNKLWKDYVANLEIPTTFLHKNEFIKKYPDEDVCLPAIVRLKTEKLSVVVSCNEFKTISNQLELISLLQTKLFKK